MRIKPSSRAADPAAERGGRSTRADRASDHAAARQRNRHAERDYFGRVIEERDPYEGMTEGAVMRAQTGMVRLDAWLGAHGMTTSRERAKALVSSGAVLVNGTTRRVKPSTPIGDAAVVEVRAPQADQDAADAGAPTDS